MNTTWRDEIVWSAGFFDGEGHIGIHRGGHSQGPWKRTDLYLTISQCDRYVLDRFHSAVGVGKVTGPFVRSYRNPNERDVFYYQLTRFEHVQAVVAMLWDFLSPVKRNQAFTVLREIKQRPNHRPTCKNGHLRNSENLYWSPDGKWRLCRACQREKDQRHRAKLKLLKSEQTG